jgi:hypothetical protein
MKSLVDTFNTAEKRAALHDYIMDRVVIDDNGETFWVGPYSCNGSSPMACPTIDNRGQHVSARRALAFVLNGYKEPSSEETKGLCLPLRMAHFELSDGGVLPRYAQAIRDKIAKLERLLLE